MRDGRIVLHMLPGPNDDEFQIRGRAIAIDDPETRTLILTRGPHFAHADDYFFAYRIKSVATAYWVNVGKPGTYPARRRWPSE